MNNLLLNEDVQNYLSEHLNDDPNDLLFKGSPFDGIAAGELVDQIRARKKNGNKWPEWMKTSGIYFPVKRSLEQSSSEATAKYKANLVSGHKLADLTGGMGVDSWAFAQHIQDVDYIELNEELVDIAKHNFKILGQDNIKCHCSTAEDFLHHSPENYDWIYLDPARRASDNSRLFLLEETLPNVISLKEELLKRGKQIMIKTSPLLDIKQGLKDLPETKAIHVVSVMNEVKELLWIVSNEHAADCEIHAVNIAPNKTDPFTFMMAEEETAALITGEIDKYLYEPNTSLLKAGAFKLPAVQFDVHKLNQHSHLYSSDKLMAFPGKRFEVLQVIPYNKKKLKSLFGKQRMHIVKRNYPESVANIRKKTGILEGGEDYLFFTTDHKNQRVVIHCKRLAD